MFLTSEQSAALRGNERLSRKAEQATRLLDQVTEEGDFPIRASWDFLPDAATNGVVLLDLTDSTDMTRTRLFPEEFDNPRLLESKLNRLWGELLRARAKTKITGLLETLRSGGE